MIARARLAAGVLTIGLVWNAARADLLDVGLGIAPVSMLLAVALLAGSFASDKMAGRERTTMRRQIRSLERQLAAARADVDRWVGHHSRKAAEAHDARARCRELEVALAKAQVLLCTRRPTPGRRR